MDISMIIMQRMILLNFFRINLYLPYYKRNI